MTSNQAFIVAAKHCLYRTSWGFSDQERKCRDLIIDAIEALRKSERLIEMGEAEE